MTKTPEELTEEWKAKKLKTGWYYVKIEGFKGVYIDLYDKEGNSWLCNSDKDLNPLNVIAPVPTYDEYKSMRAELAEHRRYCCCNENEALRLKLAELEDLLNECQAHLSLGEIGTSVTPINVLLTRIKAALGESEE